jgi:NADH-quinone oxidoreductase subunit N
MEQSDAIERKNATKYLLLSSIATGFFLYGSSLYYSKFGSLCFFYINNSNSLIFIFGTILILGALLFEIHAAPFHSWAIDVYENAPLGVVLFFDTIFQFFMFFIFARMLDIFISKCILFYKPFLIVVSILSMLIGGIMPIKQNSIRKFIAYASVGHIGFILSILATANYAIDFKYSMFYISSYIVASACFFFSIFILNTIQPIKNFSDMKGAISEVPIIGYSILLSMFSMIGLPPFVNFIAKLRVINFLIDNNSWSLLVVSLLYSVLTIIYTVRAARYLFTTSKSKTQKAYEKQKIKLAFCPIVILILGVFVSSQIEESFSKIFAHLE